jgi:hypothetical protein
VAAVVEAEQKELPLVELAVEQAAPFNCLLPIYLAFLL